MLVLTQNLSKAGGIRIRTHSGDIWLTMLPGQTASVCRIAIDAPKDFEIMRSELLSQKKIGRNCAPAMAGLLKGSLQKKRKSPQGYMCNAGTSAKTNASKISAPKIEK